VLTYYILLAQGCLTYALLRSADYTPRSQSRKRLLDRTGGYKLCDFGSATTKLVPPRALLTAKDIKLLEDDIGRQTTLQYRAPEMVDLFQRRGINEKSGAYLKLNLRVSILVRILTWPPII
jgi:hypothetical protein